MKAMRTFRRAAAAAVFALCIAASGCGDPNDNGSSDTSSAEETTARTERTETSAAGASDTSSSSSSSADPSSASDSAVLKKKPSLIEPRGDDGDGGELSEDFLAGAGDFSVELFKSSALEDIESGKNALISPESVMMALSMSANGAAGDTLGQMTETLCGGMELDDLNENMRVLKNRTGGGEVVFNIADSVWIRESGDFKIKEDFLSAADEFFGAEVFTRPFDKAAVGEMNGWVNENTNGMIPSIINDVDPSAYMYLINAIAFEGEWAEEYGDDQVREDGKFTAYDGKVQDAVMLESGESYYFSDDGAEGFLKYYKGGEQAFMAILPNEGTDIAEYARELTGEKLRGLFKCANPGLEVNAKIPEFTYDYSKELSGPLKEMGMELPFDREKADFSETAELSGYLTGLYISKIMHKTYIELDRKGTKAAAATAIQYYTDEEEEPREPKNVYLDRPFLYAIIDAENGFPIFIGAVNSLE